MLATTLVGSVGGLVTVPGKGTATVPMTGAADAANKATVASWLPASIKAYLSR